MFDTNRKLSFEEVHAFLTAEGKPAKKTTRGARYYCPLHDDTNPSLDVDRASDGSALVLCRSHHCEVHAYLWDQLRGSGEYRPAFTPSPPKKLKPKKRWGELEQAWNAYLFHRPELTKAAHWDYVDAMGATVGAVVRYNKPGGDKTFSQFNKNSEGWLSGGWGSPGPLYNLRELLKADPSQRVYVTEGEKAADAGDSLGWLTVTSAGGSTNAAKTDWSPMRGRTVIVLPDNDESGRKYAKDVTRLCYAAGAREVFILHLVDRFPHLKPKGDLADLVESGEVVA